MSLLSTRLWTRTRSSDEPELTTEWNVLLNSLTNERRATVLVVNGNAGVPPATAGVVDETVGVALRGHPRGSRMGAPTEGRPYKRKMQARCPRSPIRLWVAAERLPQLLAVFPEVSLEPSIVAPASLPMPLGRVRTRSWNWCAAGWKDSVQSPLAVWQSPWTTDE